MYFLKNSGCCVRNGCQRSKLGSQDTQDSLVGIGDSAPGRQVKLENKFILFRKAWMTLNGLESIHAEVHRGEMIWSLD